MSEQADASRADVVVGGDATGGRVALIRLRETRGDGPPRHVHLWEDEIVYILTGEVTFHRGEDRLQASTGACVLLARGCEHTWRVESDEATLLVIVAPAGLEAFYREVDWDDAPVEHLITVAARYGIEITGLPAT